MHELLAGRAGKRAGLFALLALTTLAAAHPTALAGHEADEIIGLMQARGYHDVRITDVDADSYELLACRQGVLYELKVSSGGTIEEIEREGECGARGARAGQGVQVQAPHARVEAGRGAVDVQAPFTDVHVGRDGVRVRAPFVDIRIPR
ncbi:MAG: hypothetical protein Kow0032_24410 [Methyloligellaceae bacterium]